MTSTVTWGPPVQFGVGVVLGPDVWSDTPLASNIPFSGVDIDSVGIIFDAGTTQDLRFDTVGGQNRILDGPIVASFSLNFLATHIAPSTAPFRMQIGLVADPQPADFSTAVFPFFRNEIDLGTFDLGSIPVTPSTLAVSLSLDATLIRSHITSRSTWNGRLALSLRNPQPFSPQHSYLIDSGTSITATTEQQIFFGGLIGGPSGPRQRYVWDGRFGMPALNTELIRDGDNPALFVRAHDWDPEDPETEYRPRSGEGTVDDGIPE